MMEKYEIQKLRELPIEKVAKEIPPRMERRRTVPDPRRLCTGYGKVPSGRMGHRPGYVL